jgi:ribose/xylose/arabinose/galactoside ABC-type transport system permease subunit
MTAAVTSRDETSLVARARAIYRAPLVTVRVIGGQNLSLLLALGALVAIIGSQRSNFFLTANLINIGVAVSLLGMVSLAQTVAIISGGLDISVGPIVGLTSVVAAMAAVHSGAWGVVAALLLGAGCGLVNGLLILLGRVNPIITTLATYSAFQGATFIAANGKAIGVFSNTFNVIGENKIIGLPIPLLMLIVMVLIFAFVLGYTDIGRRVYAIGGNPTAARLAGIPLRRYTVGIYVVGGVVAGIAGVILTARTGAGIADSGAVNLSLESITAVLLGGCALSGGRGSVFGTVLGVLLLGVLDNGLVLLNVQQFYQYVAQGSLLVLAVMIQEYRSTAGGFVRGLLSARTHDH